VKSRNVNAGDHGIPVGIGVQGGGSPASPKMPVLYFFQRLTKGFAVTVVIRVSPCDTGAA
jgi:hypothetical protein